MRWSLNVIAVININGDVGILFHISNRNTGKFIKMNQHCGYGSLENQQPCCLHWGKHSFGASQKSPFPEHCHYLTWLNSSLEKLLSQESFLFDLIQSLLGKDLCPGYCWKQRDAVSQLRLWHQLGQTGAQSEIRKEDLGSKGATAFGKSSHMFLWWGCFVHVQATVPVQETLERALVAYLWLTLRVYVSKKWGLRPLYELSQLWKHALTPRHPLGHGGKTHWLKPFKEALRLPDDADPVAAFRQLGSKQNKTKQNKADQRLQWFHTAGITDSTELVLQKPLNKQVATPPLTERLATTNREKEVGTDFWSCHILLSEMSIVFNKKNYEMWKEAGKIQSTETVPDVELTR